MKAMEFLKHLFIIDQRTGKLSHTKFLSVTGGLVMIGLFPYVVVNEITTNIELWLVFGALILGNRSLNKWLDKKYGTADETKSV